MLFDNHFVWSSSSPLLVDKAVSIYESIQVIGNKTCLFGKFHTIDSNLLYSYPMELKYLLWMLLAFVFALIHRVVIPCDAPTKRHAFMTIVGILVTQWIYGPDWIHFMLATLGIYSYLNIGLYIRQMPAVASRLSAAPIAKDPFTNLKSAKKPTPISTPLASFLLPWYCDPLHPIYAFALCFAHLVLCHWYQLHTNPERHFNFTTSQMWLVIKLTLFATHFHDDLTGRSKLKPPLSTQGGDDLLLPRLPSQPSVRLPRLLPFLGYTFCFTNLLAGPAFSFAAYQRGIHLPVGVTSVETLSRHLKGGETIDISNNSSSSHTADLTSVWSSSRYSLFLLLQGGLCLLLHQALAAVFTSEELLSSDFGTRFSPAFQLGIYYPGYTLMRRMLMYFGWKLFEGASVMAGFGYVGPTPASPAVALKQAAAPTIEPGKEKNSVNINENPAVVPAPSRVAALTPTPEATPEGTAIVTGGDPPCTWTGVSNSNILRYELLTPSMHSLKYWNLTTQAWLQECVYKRTGGSLLITYAVNALWHGLDPGYYIFVSMLMLYTLIERWGSQSLAAVRVHISKRVTGRGGSDVGDDKMKERDKERNISRHKSQDQDQELQVAMVKFHRVVSVVTWFLSWYVTVIAISYAQVYFCVLSWDNCLVVFANTHQKQLWSHIALLVGLLVLVWAPQHFLKVHKVD